MTEQIEMPEESLVPRGVGPQLRLAREKLGLSVAELAAETRIAQRHIESIEAGDFASLPARTYAVGFARTLARKVQLDEGDVVAMVREEMDAYEPASRHRNSYEPGDPARAPSGRLVWFSIIAVVILLVGLFMAARTLFSPAAQLPSLVEQQEAEQAAAAAAAAQAQQAEEAAVDPTGEVVFTAQGPAWVRFYDAQNRVLMEKEMAEGESYTLPADAEGPRLITGRPDLLTITIGGREVPRISEEIQTVSNVPVGAEELLAREAPAAAATPAPAATGTPEAPATAAQ